MKTIWMILALSASTIILGACTSPTGNNISLPGTKWELLTLNDASPIQGTSLTLFFGTDGNAGGNAGCNTYGGSYTVNGSSLTFGPLISTMMACEPSIMDQEQAFLKGLGDTKSFEATSDKLTLKDSSGKELAVFSPFKPSSLEGEWEALSINNGKQAVVSVAIGTTVTALFGPDGSLSGNGGCNSYNSTYTVDGDKLSIGAISSTRKACEQAVMDQEQAYFAALTNSSTYTLGDGTLELRSSDGALQVKYNKAP